MTQREVLGVLVSTIEEDHHLMDEIVKEDAIKLLVELQNSIPEQTCEKIESDCRLGLCDFLLCISLTENLCMNFLALLGHCKPLETEYLRVLSIDGGGIRGILVIELMKRLEEITKKSFFELFDFICGVSTGSIFVCGLAAKPRTLSEGKMLYKDVAYKVFHRPSTFDIFASASRMMLTHAYYDVELWESLLQQHITKTRIIDTAKFKHVPKFCCVSTTVSDEAIRAHVFRNYILPSNVESIYNGSHTAALWEVVRCSSAAPTYFGDFILDNQIHQDGGILFVSFSPKKIPKFF